MAGMSGRMSTVIKAKISKLLDKAEDPAETLDYSYQKQLESLQSVKKGIADVVTAKKRLQMQSAKLEQSVVKLDTQARQALSQGNEELARTALERKNVAQTELQSLDQQVAELEAQQQKLIDSEQKLRAKIEAFRTKKEVIKAQYSAAEAQVRISEAATGVGEEMADVGLAMQRAVDKTENMRARADAVAELEAAGTFDDLTQLGAGQDDIDRQLHELSSGAAGRRRAGPDEGRARHRASARVRRRPSRREADAGTEERRRDRPDLHRGRSTSLDDEPPRRLNELDDAVVAAVDAGDEDRFHDAFEELLALRPRDGRARSPTTTSTRSDVILPPADLTLRRGRRGVHGRGPRSPTRRSAGGRQPAAFPL